MVNYGRSVSLILSSAQSIVVRSMINGGANRIVVSCVSLAKIPFDCRISQYFRAGPALSLLLAGPAVSLPNMIVLYKIMGLKKTLVYILLVVVFSTMAGVIYGNLIA